MAIDSEPEQSSIEPSFVAEVVGPATLTSPWLRRWMAVAPDRRIALAAAALAALLFVPYLGAVGLWDPWETHYGEVAREMIQRNDYVHPFWENAWFFSKPVFTMWMMAAGMQVVGTNRAEGALALYTEWGFRLPFALFSILAIGLLAYALARVVNRRTGLAAAFVLCTMPMYFLITRQAVTDTPIVCAMICAMACVLVAQLDRATKSPAAWWYAFYVFCAIGTLAKGLLGVGLPAVILVLYACTSVIPWNAQSVNDHLRWLHDSQFSADVKAGKRPMPALWAQMYRMKLLTGIGVFLLVAGPWYAVMFAFDGVDDESKLFWYRFLVHDHLNRLAAGVHTTTPGGTFTYFLEQGGFAIFPWVALVPGAVAVVSRLKLRSPDPADQAGVLTALWLVFSFGLIGSSATKFHHYVFPMLPPLAILIGLFIDKLWREGIARHAVSLVFGVPFLLLVGKDLAERPKNFTDLFVYNYDRPYPTELVQRPIVLNPGRLLYVGDLLALGAVAAGAYLLIDALSASTRRAGARTAGVTLIGLGLALGFGTWTRGEVVPSLAVAVACLVCAGYVGFEAFRAPVERRSGFFAGVVGLGMLAFAFGAQGLRGGGRDLLLAPLMETANLMVALGYGFFFGGAVSAVAAIAGSRTKLFGAFGAFALTFALWFNWSHWVDLSHHWTQRDLFWRYYELRKPGEPIAAFLMNWRGETFYSRNTVKQVKDNGLLNQYANQPGREFALVEHNRLSILKSAVGADKTVTLIDRDLNNKFVLVTID